MVETWMRADRRQAVDVADPHAIEQTAAARSLVLERLAHDPLGRDTLHACAALGTLLAREGASPTLAAATMDGARLALAEGENAPGAADAARAAFAEAYARAREETLLAVHTARWDAPRCAVPLGGDAFAIAAGVPDGDSAAVQQWADATAAWLRRNGARRIVCAGGDLAVAALADALAVFGLEIEHGPR